MDLYESLPPIFEGNEKAYPVRVHFYNLVGKLVAKSYATQINDWCIDHGTVFSGHYLGEEYMYQHVEFYGNYIEVLKNTGYPGIDVLHCYPEIYIYNVAKYAQMAARKMKTNGLMAEICPFRNLEEFKKNPIENMTGVIGLLFLGGVRKVNSYFRAKLYDYDERIKTNPGYMNEKQSNEFNEYVGRLSYMLDGVYNDCNIFVYYGLEDAQAKMIPCHSAISGRVMEADASTERITKKIIESGYDFYYIDKDDLKEATETMKISGNEVKVIIVPSMDVMHEESYECLKKLKENGVKVLFLDKLPKYLAKVNGEILEKSDFELFDDDKIIEYIKTMQNDFNVKCDEDVMIVKGKFTKENLEIYFVDNNTRQKDAQVEFSHAKKSFAKVYNPCDGTVETITMGEKYIIPSFRGVFVVFEK